MRLLEESVIQTLSEFSIGQAEFQDWRAYGWVQKTRIIFEKFVRWELKQAAGCVAWFGL